MQLDDMIELIQMIVDSEQPLTAETTVDAIEGWDSVNALRLFSQLEKASGTSLSMKQFMATRTVSDLAELLEASA